MKYFRWVFLFIWVMVSFAPAADPGEQPGAIVLAMCRPLVSQIKNIEQLYEKDIIPLERIRVVGRIRTGAAVLTGNPIIDLLELTRRSRD